jgi:hypothetical protein
MPVLWEKIHGAEAHDLIPVEDAFRDGREDPVVDRVGVDASALDEVFGVREITFRSWLAGRGVGTVSAGVG